MRCATLLLALVTLPGCRDTQAPPSPAIPAPSDLSAEAVGMTAVRLQWAPVGSAEVISYRVERRQDLTGPFLPVGGHVPQAAPGPVIFFDVGLTPDTYYGYRVIAVSRFGDPSGPSLVRAARTPPLPGIVVTTASIIPTPHAADPDGYLVVRRGPADSATVPIALNGQQRFSPLPPGVYAVELLGLAPYCAPEGAAERAATVTDQGVRTVDTVRYVVTCRDPNLGSLVAMVTVSGDSLDASGYALEVTGLADDATLPDSVRIVSRRAHVDGAGGSAVFHELLPGDYEVGLDSVAGHCTVADGRVRSADVAPLDDDSVHFAVHCPGSGGGGAGRPYVFRNAWEPGAVPSGQRTTLQVTLDVSANPAERVSGTQSELRYDPAVLRFDSAAAGDLRDQFTVNSQTAGVVSWLAFSLGTPPGGVVTVARFHFTAVGATGVSAATRTAAPIVVAGDQQTQLDTLVRVVEDTLPITSGTANQPPVAEANGPYDGTTGSPIAFSAAGSSDPDGSIASYHWTFGDGGSATGEGGGATAGHAYTSAGTYTATLTVTDNQGATDTDQATVTVTSDGGDAPPFTWSGTFGAVNPADSVGALTLTLDLTTDIPETPGPEALATFAVDSLKWNPAVLRFHAFTWGPGGAGSVQYPTTASPGKLVFSSFTLPTTANSGLLTLATIRFKVIGTPGQTTTTATAVGPLIGTPATGPYNYRPRTAVQEAALTAP